MPTKSETSYIHLKHCFLFLLDYMLYGDGLTGKAVILDT